MSEVRISAEPRTEFGKGGARRTRRAGKIPAVLYGHGEQPRHISLVAREFGHVIKSGINTLLTLDIDGVQELALPKAIQRDPLKGTYDHVDLLLVRRGETVTVELPIVLVGTPVPGGLVNQDLTTIAIEAEATHIPDSVEVDVTGLAIGSHINAGAVTLPTGAILASDPEALVVGIVEAQASAAEETAEGESGS